MVAEAHRFGLLTTSLNGRTLWAVVHTAVPATGDVGGPRTFAADEPAPDWYAFQHPLTAEALLAQLTHTTRVALSEQAADAIETLNPGLPGDWCPLAATLRANAGDPVRAGRLFTEAGRRALADGAIGSAVAMLDRAERLLAEGGDSTARAEALEALLPALAETGDLTRALSLTGSLRELVGAGPVARAARASRSARWVRNTTTGMSSARSRHPGARRSASGRWPAAPRRVPMLPIHPLRCSHTEATPTIPGTPSTRQTTVEISEAKICDIRHTACCVRHRSTHKNKPLPALTSAPLRRRMP